MRAWGWQTHLDCGRRGADPPGLRAAGWRPTWIAGGGVKTHLDFGRRAVDPPGFRAAGVKTHLDFGRRAVDPPGLRAVGCITTWIVAAGWLLYLYFGRFI